MTDRRCSELCRASQKSPGHERALQQDGSGRVQSIGMLRMDVGGNYTAQVRSTARFLRDEAGALTGRASLRGTKVWYFFKRKKEKGGPVFLIMGLWNELVGRALWSFFIIPKSISSY